MRKGGPLQEQASGHQRLSSALFDTDIVIECVVMYSPLLVIVDPRSNNSVNIGRCIHVQTEQKIHVERTRQQKPIPFEIKTE